ncbi:DUF3320 domain-containing protein [Serratia fonticola]|uniref:DUF3320 domain-containing protein n=1 Tax=Serratia fonticola TaxID=47917 RepID=UPI0027EBABF7|nr:DUF3320 domain-containing protein [Serratia fonticola]MDQ7210430.1 DUF3320 domain-containing protein [Serratia fonticola]HBE9080332.1 DUF3320 domain-containing protein [Serratia fonticola]HBE9153053.1 DUF3320 domain-containing protein [Serratia fonticola]
MNDNEGTLFQSNAFSLEQKLERARAQLLDLGARNRLLNIPRARTSKFLDVCDERSEDIYKLLVVEAKTFTFLHGKTGKDDDSQESEEANDNIETFLYPFKEDDTPKAQHLDTKLQTRLTAKGLQKRLLDLYHDSRTLEEEQGVNILYLALGTLKWIDPANKENIRYAPLILIPVTLERGNVGERFKLRARNEEIIANLSLEAFLERIHQITLPEMRLDDNHELNIINYMSDIAEAVSLKPDWQVLENDITLGLFSFAKFLMYRDLDPANWPAKDSITSQPIIRALMSDGFDEDDSLLSEDAPIDPIIPPKDMLHIMDSDSSQTLAIHEVRRGKSLVIQGPPGTGKSQTIANIIASAVADGKTVLFVAEKMAALEVVKRRLDQSGVGDACLELHSNKTNKRAFLEELKRVWELGSPRGEFSDTLIDNLTEVRDLLNQHPARIHKVYSPSELTPYQVMGHLVRLRHVGQAPTNFRLHGIEFWSSNDVTKRLDLTKELLDRVNDIGIPDNHPWHGVGLERIIPSEVERLVPDINTVLIQLADFYSKTIALARDVALLPAPNTFKDIDELVVVTEHINSAPNLSMEALTSPIWKTQLTEINNLINLGLDYQRSFAELENEIVVENLSMPLTELEVELETLPDSLLPSGFATAIPLQRSLTKLLAEARQLQLELGSQIGRDTCQDIKQLIELGEKVASVPDVSPEALIASVWEQGVEQASDLVNSIVRLTETYSNIEHQLQGVAWEADVITARNSLAVQTDPLRFLSSEWRKSRAFVRSLIRDPSMPIPLQVELLDKLLEVQSLRKKIKEFDAFGQSAFGSDWRGENSNSQLLLALIDWMKTLKEFNTETRVLASRLADRDLVRYQVEQLNTTFEQVSVQLDTLWNAFGSSPNEFFENKFSINRVSLNFIEKHVKKLIWVDERSREIFKNAPENLSERRCLLSKLIKLKQLSQTIDSFDILGAQAFSDSWMKSESDWKLLMQASNWIEQHQDLRYIAANINNRNEIATLAKEYQQTGIELINLIDNLSIRLASKTETLFKVASIDELSILAAGTKLLLWMDNSEQLSKWVAWQYRASLAKKLGMSEFIEKLANGNLTQENSFTAVERTYYESLLALMVEQDPELVRFDGELHSREVEKFSDLDRKRIKAASFEVVRAHHRRIPSQIGGAGPVGILRAEMARKRGHMPIRQLMLKAGLAIQALKPVMMMSPLSIAQFLVPGCQKFDLLVMDEASQIQPVDAIGAIARCGQVVVVGDERQLPPTSFFSRMTESDNEDDDELSQVADIESVLGLFVARGLPQRMLRWHYRSRHQSLIAVSNSQFYENKLFIVPSPYTQEAGMGLLFHHVQNGVFESGSSSSNPVEARRVATAIMEHAQNHKGLSLGVATFSVSQRKAIQDELELLRRLNPELEDFFHAHPNEPFFVKNLENVQGDERDVIMISVGYAKNTNGYMAMRFGPLGAEGGERRLNVLISRAKRRCEVFASITDEDIDLERAKGKGVFAFKLFLQYARTGRLSLAQKSDRTMDSVFEEQVADALQKRGYQVHPQVGIAGFFIDLAIADPDMPGRYLIGIECDGRAYHSSRSARERDRLRQSVLEDHGWIIHRIWSSDWFQRPEEQLQRTVEAIETAKNELALRLERRSSDTRAVPIEIITIERESVTEIGLIDAEQSLEHVDNYIESTPEFHANWQLHETPASILVDLIEKIVQTESPIHVSEVVTRLRTAWGLQRAGARIEAAVNQAISIACKKGAILQAGNFLMCSASEVTLRNRQNVQSSGLRKPEMIAPEEIAVGINAVVARNLGATDDEIISSVSRMLGFRATSSVLRKTISEVIEGLLNEGILKRENTMIIVSETVEN